MPLNFNSKKKTRNPHAIELKEGSPVVGVLRGEIYEYEHAFKPDQDPKFRFRVNMIVNENGALVAKILEQGWKLYCALQDLQSAGWDLEKSYIQISRTGKGPNDTVYFASALPKQVSPEALEKISHVKLHELRDNPKNNPNPPTQGVEGDFRDSNEDIGF